MDWTLEDNMADGLFFCTTLTDRRSGHIPFAQAGAEGHSRRVGAGVGNASTESRSVVQPFRIPLVIHPERRMYVVVS